MVCRKETSSLTQDLQYDTVICACPRQVYTLRAAWFEPRAAASAVWKAGQWATTSKLMKNIIFILAVFCITAYTGVILAAKYYEVTGENPPNVI